MATISVRALNPVTWEPLQGNGQTNFLTDLAAVAQIIATRLRLFQGEWFLNLQDGLPLFQSILGASAGPQNLQVISNLISQRILGTQFVTGAVVNASYQNRTFAFSATVTTAFGTVLVSNTPGFSATLTTSIT